MKKSDFKKLIKECIDEVLSEEATPNFPTLGAALTAIEEYIVKNGIQVDTKEHPSDEADQFGIRQPFMYGGINYEDKKEAHYKLLTLKGKPTKKYLHVSIFRMPSGTYELTMYVL
jgi:hypothetical protein